MAYFIDWLELVCPVCKGELAEATGERPELRCEACRRGYPVVLGIPDLRIFPDPYISAVGDWAKGRMLADHFEEMDFAELVALYFHVTPEVPAHDVRANSSRLLGGVARAEVALESWESSFGPLRADCALDVGCGTAPLVAALSGRAPRVVGIDVAFRWLVVGRKRLDELGVSAPLVAACAEALPFREGTFDTVTMQSSLEVFSDQRAALAESLKVLRESGRLLINTPNRFSLGPDPHIGVFGGGFLPAAVVNTIAKLRQARPPGRDLLSSASLRRRLADAGFRDVRVALPGVSHAQRAQFTGLARRLADVYEHGRRAPVLSTALRAIGPLLQAEGTRR